MQFQGALVEEQGVTFAIVFVKPYVLDNHSEIDNTRAGFRQYFPGVPIVLMAQDHRGMPTYHGRQDIVQFLSRINASRIPWKKYTVN